MDISHAGPNGGGIHLDLLRECNKINSFFIQGNILRVDNFPIDILKQLSKTVVKKEFPVETRTFLELLTAFFNRVFTFGHCPSGVLHFYDAGESIRLLQGATKIRPIGKATTYRKIVDVAQLLPHRVELQKEFGDIQFCGASFGVERMHSMCISVSTPIYPTVHLTTPMLTAIRNGGQCSPG